MAMIYETNSLQHFGIKGQKWGLRRFQEEDGTLTEAGKARYGVSSGDGKISGVASKAASGKAKKENSTDEKKQKRKDFLKKAAVGLGAAALAGASVAAYKKSTNLRDQMREQAGKSATWEREMKRLSMVEAKRKLAGSRDSRQTYKGLGSPNQSKGSAHRDSAFFQNWGHDWVENAKKHGTLEKKYADVQRNATRRQAVKNYIHNRGKIVVSF